MLQPGDHIVASGALYGGTVTQLKHLSRKLGLELTFVDPDHLGQLARGAATPRPSCSTARRSATRAATCSTSRPSPTIAHDHGAPLMIDNTFATPYLCRPIEWGADIVVHSATKFIGGHGTSIGGVVVEAGTFDWSNGRFPVVADPSPAYHGLAFHETFGMYGYLMKLRAESLRDLGALHEPVQRLPVPARARDAAAAHGAPRRQRARRGAVPASSTRPWSAVRYAGLPDSPYRPLVEKYLPRGAGAVFAFDLRGGREAGAALHRVAATVEPPGQRRRRQVAW